MKLWTMALVLTVLVAAPLAAGQTADRVEVLLKATMHQELVDGDLQAAIEQYEHIVARAGGNRAVAAKALLQMGHAYEKLGRSEASAAYERLVRDYAEQAEPVGVARARLAALDRPRSPADPATMVVRRVWSGRDASWVGGVSPGGRYLSYLASGRGLAIHDLETGKDRPLANKDSWSRGNVTRNSHKLSPDGQQVAYVWHNRDSFNEVHIVGLDGSKPRVLYRNEETSRRVWDIATANHIVNRAVLAWSPDGKYVLVTFRREDRSNQLGLVSVADGSVRVLKTLGGVPPIGVSFSPDGRYIAYDLHAGEGKRDIFLLATDGSRETPLIEHPANDQFPVWAPDGKRILFVSDRTGSLDAWLIQVADGKPRGAPELIKSGIGPIWPLGFTRNGSFYYGLSTGTLHDVYTAALDPATGTLLSSPRKVSQPFVGSNSQPDWSPDGQYLAYFRQQGPLPIQASVVIRSVDTGEVRELPRQIGYIQYYRGLRWSPDGRSILVKGSNNRRWGLYELDAQTGAVTPIVQTTGSGGSRPEYSPDGRAIFYWRSEGSAGAGPTRIVARDLESGAESDLLRVVPPASISHIMVVSPDGQRLAFFMADSDTQSMALKVMPAAGGEPRELLRVHRPDDFGNLHNYSALAWTPDGRELLFGKRTAASRSSRGMVELWRISAEGGAPQRVGLAMNRLSHLRFHPDGQRIVFDAVDARPENNEVWVMEHFLPELSATQ